MEFSYKKNIVSSLVTQYGNTLIGFFNSIVITRILAGYGRGEMALYTNFVALAVLFFGFSLTTGIVYFVASKKMSPTKVLQLSFSYFGVTSLLVLLVIIGLSKLGKLELLLPVTKQQNAIFAICIVGFFLNSMNAVFTGVYNGLKRIHDFNRVSLLFNFSSFAFLLVIYLAKLHVQKDAFLLVVLIQLLFQLLQFVILVYYLVIKRKTNEDNYEYNTSLLNNFSLLFKFSTLIYFTNLLAFFTYKLDVWIVNYYQGKAELGVYSLAVSLAQMLWLLPNAIAFVNLSEVAGKNEQGRSLQLTKSSYKLAFYSTIVLSVFFYIFCFFFVPVLFGSEFNRVPSYLLLLFIGVVPFAPVSIISSYLAGINKFRHNFYASLIGVVLCIILDFLLIPRFGVAGACIASSVSYLSIFIYLTCYLKHICNVPFKDLFQFSSEEKQQLYSLLSKKILNNESSYFGRRLRHKTIGRNRIETKADG